MLKIGIIGIAAVFFAVLLKRDSLSFQCFFQCLRHYNFCFCIGAARHDNLSFFKGLLSKLPVEPAFFVTMVKMLGIAYIAEFHPQSVRTVVIAQLHRR